MPQGSGACEIAILQLAATSHKGRNFKQYSIFWRRAYPLFAPRRS
jgi:hypothetical protein